jgi:hypothetical protein
MTNWSYKNTPNFSPENKNKTNQTKNPKDMKIKNFIYSER